MRVELIIAIIFTAIATGSWIGAARAGDVISYDHGYIHQHIHELGHSYWAPHFTGPLPVPPTTSSADGFAPSPYSHHYQEYWDSLSRSYMDQRQLARDIEDAVHEAYEIGFQAGAGTVETADEAYAPVFQSDTRVVEAASEAFPGAPTLIEPEPSARDYEPGEAGTVHRELHEQTTSLISQHGRELKLIRENMQAIVELLELHMANHGQDAIDTQ